MDLASFRRNFPPGTPVPDRLRQLLEFQNRSRQWYSGHFELVEWDYGNAAWFGGDKRYRSCARITNVGTDTATPTALPAKTYLVWPALWRWPMPLTPWSLTRRTAEVSPSRPPSPSLRENEDANLNPRSSRCFYRSGSRLSSRSVALRENERTPPKAVSRLPNPALGARLLVPHQKGRSADCGRGSHEAAVGNTRFHVRSTPI